MIPDKITFGRGLNYGDVRKFEKQKDHTALIECLHKRIEHFLLEQTSSISSPFPLSVMCCIAVETIGQIMYSDKELRRTSGSQIARGELSQRRFAAVLNDIDTDFGKKISRAQEIKLKANSKQVLNSYFDTVGGYVYGHFRNGMIHGYQAAGVYLTDKGNKMIYFDSNAGAYVINPYLLFKRICLYWAKLYKDALSKPRAKSRQKFVSYVQKLVL